MRLRGKITKEVVKMILKRVLRVDGGIPEKQIVI